MTVKNMNIKINTLYIKLDQLLKFSGVAPSGADAKEMILSGIVSVNDEPCTMRGKKIRPSDNVLVELDDEYINIYVEQENDC